jgi:hypothetical protein
VTLAAAMTDDDSLTLRDLGFSDREVVAPLPAPTGSH